MNLLLMPRSVKAPLTAPEAAPSAAPASGIKKIRPIRPVGCACSAFLIELFLSGAAEWAYRRLEGIRVRTQFCAWTLGLTIPNTLIGRADELIE
jgi:hypothetical protein